jgi:hypothetical protein
MALDLLEMVMLAGTNGVISGQITLTRPEPGSSGPAAPHSKPQDPSDGGEYNPDQCVLSGRRWLRRIGHFLSPATLNAVQ